LIERKNEGEISLSYKDRVFNIKFKNIVKGRINFELDGIWISSYVTSGKDVEDFVFIGNYEFMLKPLDFLPAEPFIKESPGVTAGGNAIIRSPLHGKIIKLNAVLDRKVYKGEVLFILDAMKIESKIIAPIDGLIKDIRINEGDQVRINQTIMTILR
jgi:acetyl/propionyl-CoA carboxylase alpha subunit